MKSRRTWWLIFGGVCLAVLGVLVWVTVLVLRLEAQAQHQAGVRLALWRMDSWLGPRLAREAARPYFEYVPFYAQQRAYTKILNPIQKDEVYSASSLLTFESEFFPLHFQVDAAGHVTSPQAPEGNWRDLAEASYIDAGAIERKRPVLERVAHLIVAPQNLDSCVMASETMLAKYTGEDAAPIADAAPPAQQLAQQWAAGAQQSMQVENAMSKADMQKRAMYNTNALPNQSGQVKFQQQQQVLHEGQVFQQAQMAEEEAVEVGALVPVWLGEDDKAFGSAAKSQTLTLLFVRRVQVGGQKLYQGVLADWPRIQGALLEEVGDLFPRARLQPLTSPAAAAAQIESGQLLATVPVSLEAACPVMAGGPFITPARTTLGITWLAVIGSIIAAGITLRSSIAYGEKRSRFASAVTHELRTPLTTFRMYSEMLAEGMVKDEAQRATYLQTLKSESCRLATLVENVLSYARLEDGRAVSHAQATTVGEMLKRVEGVLSRRAADGKMELRMENAGSPDTPISVDVEVVGQILFNLVDNACKYANGSSDRRIELRAGVENGSLNISVRDHGPGIAAEFARRIFVPFDRGSHGPGDTIPGVGLGLALARGLARDLRGDLTLTPQSNGQSGASFKLSLPA